MDELEQLKVMAGLGNKSDLQEYSGYGSVAKTEGSNPSITANEKIQYQNNNNIQPGTPEWFQLWFSKPYLTGEKPF